MENSMKERSPTSPRSSITSNCREHNLENNRVHSVVL
jgi:hypothetical protein